MRKFEKGFNGENRLKRHLETLTRRGVRIDPTSMLTSELDLADELKNLRKKVLDMTDGMVKKANSTAQLAVWFESQGIPYMRNSKGNPSIRRDFLERVEHPAIASILEYRDSLALHSQIRSIMKTLRVSNRVYPEYDAKTCETGRIYSKNPNIMGWNKSLRKNILADEGYTKVTVDYKSQDLRVLAAYSDCKALKQIFINGEDPHAMTVAMMLNKDLEDVTPEERQFGKSLNFGTVYGQTPLGLARTLDCSVEEAEQHQENYFNTYPEVLAWIREVEKEARHTGYSETYLGRRRYLNYNISPMYHDKLNRQAVNTPIQGTGADLLRYTLAVLPANNEKIQVLYPNHDEIILQYRDDIPFDKVKTYVESIMVQEIKGVIMEVEWGF